MSTLRDRLQAMASGVLTVDVDGTKSGPVYSLEDMNKCHLAINSLVKASQRPGKQVLPPSEIMPLLF